MDFAALQDEVLSDRFGVEKRDATKNWLNYRYGRLWGMEPWTFKNQISTLNVPMNTQSIARGTIGRISALWDSTLSPNYQGTMPLRPEDFYYFASLSAGTPYNWTVIGDNIVFDRPMGSARTFTVVNEKPFTALVNDTDVPLIPSEYHLVLASGASSHGLRLENDPSWEAFENDWSQGIEDMKKNYLTPVLTFTDSYPDWP